MASHGPHPTDPGCICGLTRTPSPIVTTTAIKQPLDAVELAQFENDMQDRLFYDPSPDLDSLVEGFAALLKPDADHAAVVAQMMPIARRMYESNRRERDHERAATGHLNLTHRTLHTEGPEGARSRHGLSVLQAVAMLREPLRVLRKDRDMGPREKRDGIAVFHASLRVGDVIRMLPADTLRGSYLRHELGTGPHDLLLHLLGDHQTESQVAA